jgi:hypothetical protein
MTWRRAALYWACFFGLLAYYFAVLHKPDGPAAAHLTRAPFLQVDAARLDSVEVRRGSERVRCVRAGDRWQVVDPAGRRAPSDLISALIDNLTQLPDVEVIADGAADLAPFGLAPPVSELTLSEPDRHPVHVRLGNPNPAGTAVYAQREGDARVFLIGLNVRYYEDLLWTAVRQNG